MTDEALIIAYVDDELDQEARARVEADAARDPDLAAAIARHRRLRETIAGAWSDVLDEPVPESLHALATAPAPGSAKVVSWRPRAQLPGLPQWVAMAACLAIGVFIGRGLMDRGPLSMGPDGALSARGALAAVLDDQTAAQAAAAPIRVGLSFRTPDRRYCRTFESGRDRLAGVACREAGRWAVRMTTAYQAPTSGPDYRTASSGTPPAVLAAVDSMIAGVPLDAAAEAAARSRGWVD